MKSSPQHITVSRTARYELIGQPSAQTRHVWFALHGYGQLAAYFAKHFESIGNGETVVVVPEGLSRFYLDGVYGRVGASWMTKEDRLSEIQDYTQYLTQLADHILAQCAPDPQITVLGFSQGNATAWRWMLRSSRAVHNFVVWAGSLPTEGGAEAKEKLQKMNIYTVIGTQDEYISQEKADEQIGMLRKSKPDLKHYSFEGEHRMDASTLAAIAAEIRGHE